MTNIITNHTIEIKYTTDNIWDVYLDNVWVYSRTDHENVIDELTKIMEKIEDKG